MKRILFAAPTILILFTACGDKVESGSAANVYSVVKQDVEARHAFEVEIRYTDHVSAEALLRFEESITIVPRRNVRDGGWIDSADPRHQLDPGRPGISVRIRSLDPKVEAYGVQTDSTEFEESDVPGLLRGVDQFPKAQDGRERLTAEEFCAESWNPRARCSGTRVQ